MKKIRKDDNIMGENEEEKKLNIENEEKVQENVPAKEEKTNAEVKKEETKVTSEKKEEPNFKKVETKTKKSKHGVAKAILILIGLLVVVYFIFVMRNYLILNAICKKASAYKDVTNYTYHLKGNSGEYTASVKDNISRMDQTSVENEDRTMIIWSDKNTGETIVAFPNQKTAQKNTLLEIPLAVPFEYVNIDNRIMGMVLYTWIYTDEFDGKECYVICLDSNYKEWVEKETGLIVKKESKDSSTEITNIGINNVDEIYKPDLTGYEITDETNSIK